MGKVGPRGFPPSPSSPSAPGRLDEALGGGGGPSLPWLILLVGCLHRAYIQSGSGATSSTADRSLAESSTADRSLAEFSTADRSPAVFSTAYCSPAAFSTADCSRAEFSTADRSSPPPSRHIDEAGGGGEEFPLVARYGTNPVVPRLDVWARFDELYSLPHQDGTCFRTNPVVPPLDVWARFDELYSLPHQDGTCFRIWEASGSVEDSRFQRGSCPADQHPDAWGHMHEEVGLTLRDVSPSHALQDGDGDDLSCIPRTSSFPIMLMTEATETVGKQAANILADVVAEGTMLTEAVDARPPPVLRGCMGSLPHELLIKVARVLAKQSVQDAVSMKLTCKSWNAAFEMNGSPAVSVFKIASQDDGSLALVPVHCLYPPPVHTRCWGSSKGLLALQLVTDNSVCLHCPTCGYRKALPTLPLNYDPKGIFVRTDTFVMSLMTDVSVPHNEQDQLVLDTTLMFLQQLETDAGNEGDEELTWFWNVYPGADQFTPVRSVNFLRNTTFSAATAESIFIVDRTDRLLNQPFLIVGLTEMLGLDAWIATWMFHGHHIFFCGHSAYLCILTRSTLDAGDIGIRCFQIEQNPDSEFSLSEVDSFGPYSVYLGSNQPLVVSAIDGVPGRSPNTVYIEDHDGIVRNRRVLAINVETQAKQAIVFPEDFHFAPTDTTASAWVALSSENCHITPSTM